MKKKLLLTASLLFGAMQFTNAQENEIPESGNVGIGTTSPTEKLDVRGGANIDSTLKVGDSLTVTNSARVGEDFTVMGNAYFKNDATVLGTFYLPNPFQSDGLEGIDLLVVKSDGSVQKAGVGQISDILYTKECYTVNGVVPAPTWHNGPNKIFVDCPEVNVGIGTNTPLNKLDVRGVGSFTTGVLAGNILNTNYTNTALYEGLRSEGMSGPLMRLAVRKTDGTNEVRFKVEKEGTVYCTSVRIRLSPTIPIPDYVFNPTYQLMPLSEVKTFVTSYSHLPNIPSEKEIREEGLSLDEMQLKMLQKIEELTLYVIDLNEKSEAQAKDNAALKAEIEALKAQLNLKAQ